MGLLWAAGWAIVGGGIMKAIVDPHGAIVEIWPAEKLGIADRGIREGILRSLMARDGYLL